MKILLSNDDGWDAPGLAVLQSLAAPYGDVWSVAPTHPMSGISHQMTFERPLQLMPITDKTFMLDGTPADCVRIGMTQLGIDFDWVLSGINNGANLGSDIYVSGTVAASREAVLRGVRSIAMSQHRRQFKARFNWAETEKMAQIVLSEFLEQRVKIQPAEFININFPDRFHLNEDDEPTAEQEVPDWKLIECDIDRHPLPSDFQLDEEGRFFYCSKYNERPRMTGCDLDVCFSGDVAVSFLKL